MAKDYTIGCLSIYNVTPTATHIAVTNLDYPTNAEVSDDGSGSIYAEQVCLTGFAPVLTVQSKAISQMLAFIGLNGQCVGAGLAVTRVDAITRRMENCDEALGGTPHIQDRVNKGLLRIGSIGVSGRDDASISVILDALAVGANAPVARTDGVAFPATVVKERFGRGVCAFAGVVYNRLNWSLDYNVQIDEKLPNDGSIWPEVVGVLTVRPSITFSGPDLSLLTAAMITAGADACAHADTILQLIRREDGATFEAFGDSVHTRITASGLLIPENIVSVAAQAKATGSLRVFCSFDGTNAPILIDTTSIYDPTPL